MWARMLSTRQILPAVRLAVRTTHRCHVPEPSSRSASKACFAAPLSFHGSVGTRTYCSEAGGEAVEVAGVDDAFAVVLVGGKQYKVTSGDLIMTEKLLGPDIGEKIHLNKVLMYGTQRYTAVGQPLLHSVKVEATVEEQTRTEKAIIFKKKRRKGYRRTKGHKQPATVLRINEVSMEQ